LMLVMPVMLNR